MRNKKHWRDQQLTGFNLKDALLQQEKNMLDFLEQTRIDRWRWCGDHNNFKIICSKQYTLTDYNYNGVIIFGHTVDNLSSLELCNRVKNLIADTECAYLGINRYLLSHHDLDFELPDTIEQSIDEIVKFCNPGFRRLHSFAQVDGNHMIASHPMDCYGLWK